MLPYIQIFSRSVPTYSIMAVIGLLMALTYLKISVKMHHPDLDADTELGFTYGLIGTFLGAKLLSILTVFPEFLSEISFLFTDTERFLEKYLYGGFVFYGGILGAAFAVWLYAKLSKVCFWDLVCVLLPIMPLIHGIGRVGCFCMGCCYGKPSHILGIAFQCSKIAPNGVPLLPVQLYEALIEICLFVILARLSVRKTAGSKMLGIYCSVYGVSRFCLEFFRGDSYRGFIGRLSISQIISLLLIAGGTILLLRRSKSE